ncbi:Uncharacterized protein APZ42_004260, partial [Daphnia magna]
NLHKRPVSATETPGERTSPSANCLNRQGRSRAAKRELKGDGLTSARPHSAAGPFSTAHFVRSPLLHDCHPE